MARPNIIDAKAQIVVRCTEYQKKSLEQLSKTIAMKPSEIIRREIDRLIAENHIISA
jgi:hypothetical protein